MNINDKQKFLDTFVDVIRFGKKSTCGKSEVDEVLKSIDENYINNFEHYLSDKSMSDELEDPDKWDDWYDNLTIEKILELQRGYDLPAEKIVITLDAEETLMRGLHAYAVEFIDKCSFYNPEDENVYACFTFDSLGMFVEVYSIKDKTVKGKKKHLNQKIKNEVTGYLKDFVNKADNLILEFNEGQGPNGIHCTQNVGSDKDYGLGFLGSDNSEGARPGCEPATIKFLTEDRLVYANGQAVSRQYIRKIFSIISDERHN